MLFLIRAIRISNKNWFELKKRKKWDSFIEEIINFYKKKNNL